LDENALDGMDDALRAVVRWDDNGNLWSQAWLPCALEGRSMGTHEYPRSNASVR